MLESGLQLQRAAADVLSSWLYRDHRLLVEQLGRFVRNPGPNADVPGQYGAPRLLTALEESSPDEQLIKP